MRFLCTWWLHRAAIQKQNRSGQQDMPPDRPIAWIDPCSPNLFLAVFCQTCSPGSGVWGASHKSLYIFLNALWAAITEKSKMGTLQLSLYFYYWIACRFFCIKMSRAWLKYVHKYHGLISTKQNVHNLDGMFFSSFQQCSNFYCFVKE